MGNFINPFTDWGFKRIFGQETGREMLLSFLNELLKGEHVITDLTFMDKEQMGETKDQRCAIYDIYCQTNTGEHIIVEMQNSYQEFFVDRTIYYACRSLANQAQVGRWDYHLAPVYVVSFMNFFFKTEGAGRKLRTDVMLMDIESKEIFSRQFRLIYLMLPQFQKEADECENNFERWIYTLKNMSNMERLPFDSAQDAIWQRLAEIADVTTLTSKERAKYDESLKVMRDNYAVQQGARHLGIEEGRKEGMKEGRKEGMKEGRKEGQRMLILAMLNKGSSIGDIAMLTGMTEDEVKSLLN